MVRPTVVIDSSDESNNDSERSSSSSLPANKLVDNEAIEADSSGNDNSSDTLDISPSNQFPRFMEFPPEIRRHVWEMFCPEIASKHPRVLHISIDADTLPSGGSYEGWGWCPGLATEDQTECLRALIRVHRETCAIVTKAFPNIIPLQRDGGGLRFNSDRDIIFQDNTTGRSDIFGSFQKPRAGTCDDIKHICFDLGEDGIEYLNNGADEDQREFLARMPKLETIMLGLHPYPQDGHYPFKGWLAEEQTVEARMNTYEKSAGLGEDLEWAFIWPDFRRHPEFLEYEVMPAWREIIPEHFQEYAMGKSAKIVPMLIFDFDHVWYLDRLKERYTKRPWKSELEEGSVPASSADEDEEDDEENEYESDGINDDTIEQWDDHDDDELIPPPISPSGPVSISSDDSESDSELAPVGNFSSPEPEDDHGEEDIINRRPKRRIVSDSDDEDEGASQPAAKRARTRAAPVALDEDDDDDDQLRPRSGSRGAPQVISDGDEEDDTSSAEGDSSSDEAPPKQLSLQQRLGPRRNHHRPAQNEDDDDSNDANSFCSYAKSDDDEEEEDSEEEGGMVDAMAGDTDDDDGPGADGDAW